VLSPAPNAVLDSTALPTQIIASFTRELIGTSVNENTFILESTGGDGSFANGTVQIAAAVTPDIVLGNPSAAMFDLNGVVLADDIYRVSLLGDGGMVILDLDGNALDGENVGGILSGNGVAGGDYQAFFTVTTPVVVQPTLASIQAEVFGPTCSIGCHNGAGGAPPIVMDLTNAGSSYLALVGAGGTGIPSMQQPAVLRVAPGDPDASYLVRKIQGTLGITGQRMPPLPAGALPPATITAIRDWIAAGALQ